MRLLFLITLVPLALAKCPSFFEGLDANATDIERFDEAVGTACGMRNYTSIFWSRRFYEQLIEQIVSNSSDGQPLAPFKPFFAHLQEKIDALDRDDASDGEVDAKDFFDSVFEKNQQELELKNPKPTNSSDEESNPGMFVATMMQSFMMPLMQMISPASAELSIALMQTMKAGFGVVETEEMKQAYIDTALRAIERVGLNSHNEKLGELLARLYVLATSQYGIPRSPFDQFAEWTEKQWKSEEIGALEILPAIELLYLQYQSLKINESRIFVDWMLISHVDIATLPPTPTTMAPPANETREEAYKRHMGKLHTLLNRIVSNEDVIEKLTTAREERKEEFAGICPSQKDGQCFKDFPEEARKEIIATFPEIFVSLKNRFNNFLSSSTGNDNRPIEKKDIEGSGEGSGLF